MGSRRPQVIEITPQGGGRPTKNSRKSRLYAVVEDSDDEARIRSSHPSRSSSSRYGHDYDDIRGPEYSSRSRTEYEIRDPGRRSGVRREFDIRGPEYERPSRSSRPSRRSRYYDPTTEDMPPIIEIREPGRRSARESRDEYVDYERAYRRAEWSPRSPRYEDHERIFEQASRRSKHEDRERRQARESRQSFESDEPIELSDSEYAYRNSKPKHRSRGPRAPESSDYEEPAYEYRVPKGAEQEAPRPRPRRHHRRRSTSPDRSEHYEHRSKRPSRPSREPANVEPQFTTAQAINWQAKYMPILKGGAAAKTHFPEPPTYDCMNPSCEGTEGLRAIKQCCEHGLQELFKLLDVNVKKERLLWHPDKWSVVQDPSRLAEFQAKASEVFVALNSMSENNGR